MDFCRPGLVKWPRGLCSKRNTSALSSIELESAHLQLIISKGNKKSSNTFAQPNFFNGQKNLVKNFTPFCGEKFSYVDIVTS